MTMLNSPQHPQWKTEFMHPIEGLMRNILHTRKQPWAVNISDVPCQVHVPLYGVARGTQQTQAAHPQALGGQLLASGIKPLDKVDFYLVVRLGAEPLVVEVGHGFPLTLHPAIADVTDDTALPQSLRQAITELLVAPLVDAFGVFMDMQITCEVVASQAVPQVAAAPQNADGSTSLAVVHDMMRQAACALPIMLTVPERGALQAISVPCIAYVMGQASAGLLYQKISTLPSHVHDIAGLSVPVSIEAGSMTLTAAECASLHVDDILLPENYPAKEGRVTLRMSQCFMPCALSEGNATVEAIVPIEKGPLASDQGENAMSSEENSAAEQVSADAVHTAALEVTVSFELERRNMTLAELSVVAPGYTFALGVNALAPVTLRVGDKVFGTGRLVDLGGTMGVQVMSLADNATVKKPVQTTVTASVYDDDGAEKRPVRGLASFKQEQVENDGIMNGPQSGEYA